jgi:hypothetical protein
MENNITKSGTGSGLGIAGLVLGIVAMPLSLFGCTSLVALILASVGVALSSVAYSQAKKVSHPSSLITAALILCVIALGTSGLRITNSIAKIRHLPWEAINKKVEVLEKEGEEFGRIFEEEFEKELGDDLEEVLRDLENELEESFEDLENDHRIIIQENGDTIIYLNSQEAASALGKATGKALRVIVEELKDSNDVNVQVEVYED